MDDDESLKLILTTLGNKIYELQIGFTALFNLFVGPDPNAMRSFAQERQRLGRLPDFREFREALEKLANTPTEREDLERFWKKYKGPIQ